MVALSGTCRLCGAGRDLSRHHLIPVRMRLEGVPDPTIRDPLNIIRLCRPCHDCIEVGELRRDLRALLSKAQVRHIVSAVGRAWLDREYPPVRRQPAR